MTFFEDDTQIKRIKRLSHLYERTDYFLTDTSCDNAINAINIIHFPFSDHDFALISTSFSKQLTIETSRSINISKHTITKYEKRINEIKDSDNNLD